MQVDLFSSVPRRGSSAPDGYVCRVPPAGPLRTNACRLPPRDSSSAPSGCTPRPLFFFGKILTIPYLFGLLHSRETLCGLPLFRDSHRGHAPERWASGLNRRSRKPLNDSVVPGVRISFSPPRKPGTRTPGFFMHLRRTASRGSDNLWQSRENCAYLAKVLRDYSRMAKYNVIIWPNQIFSIPLWPNKDNYDRTKKRIRPSSRSY